MFIELQRSLKISYQALRTNFSAAIVLQVIMVIIAGLYFLVEESRPVFEQIASWKKESVWWEIFLISGLMIGVLSEFFRVYCVDQGKWNRNHVLDMIFKFFLMGFIYTMTSYFYQFQNYIFTESSSIAVLIKKITFEFFVFSFFVTVPIQVVAFQWRDCGFKLTGLLNSFGSLKLFFIEKHLPMWIGIVVFWSLTDVVIYSMPEALQYPVCLTAGMIWGILIVNISKLSTSSSRKN